MKILLSVLIGFFVISNAHAEKVKAKILKISKSRTKALVSLDSSFEQSRVKKFLVAGPNRKLCNLRVIKVKGTKALVSLYECAFKESLKNGQKALVILSPPMLEQDEFDAQEEPFEEPADEEKEETASTPAEWRANDYAFLAPIKKSYIETGVRLAAKNFEEETSPIEETDTSSTSLFLRYGRGFTQNLTMWGELGYLMSQDTESNISGNPILEASGMTDPILGLIYRMKDGGSESMSFDFLSSLLFGIGDSEAGNGTDGGNGLNGGHKIDFFGRWSKKSASSTMLFDIGIVYHMERTLTTAGSTAETTESSHFDFGGHFGMQFQMGQAFYARGELGPIIYGGYDQEATGSTTVSTVDRGFGWDGQIILGIAPVSNTSTYEFQFNFYSHPNDVTSVSTTTLGTISGSDITLLARFNF